MNLFKEKSCPITVGNYLQVSVEEGVEVKDMFLYIKSCIFHQHTLFSPFFTLKSSLYESNRKLIIL